MSARHIATFFREYLIFDMYTGDSCLFILLNGSPHIYYVSITSVSIGKN